MYWLASICLNRPYWTGEDTDMDFSKRIRRLEDVVGQDNQPLGVALRNCSDGSISWDDRTFPDEEAFQKAVRSAFADSPVSVGPRVIVITYFRSQPM